MDPRYRLPLLIIAGIALVVAIGLLLASCNSDDPTPRENALNEVTVNETLNTTEPRDRDGKTPHPR